MTEVLKDAEALLESARQLYATCDSYADEGRLEESIRGRVRRARFRTLFRRPAVLQFSFTDEVTEDRMVTCTLDSSSKRTTFECLGETSEQTGAERERLGLALASAGGATSSSAYVIPSLLRPDLGYGQVLDFNARQVLPDSQREPILCAILEGTRPGSDLTWTLVIGRAEPFVYRVEQHGEYEGGEWHVVWTFRPNGV